MTNFAQMKKYKTSDTLTEGDIVEYEHDKTWNDESTAYFKAVCIDKTKPCMKQCDMAGVKWPEFEVCRNKLYPMGMWWEYEKYIEKWRRETRNLAEYIDETGNDNGFGTTT